MVYINLQEASDILGVSVKTIIAKNSKYYKYLVKVDGKYKIAQKSLRDLDRETWIVTDAVYWLYDNREIIPLIMKEHNISRSTLHNGTYGIRVANIINQYRTTT